MNKQIDNVEVIGGWAREPLNDGDMGALAQLTTELPTKEFNRACDDPQVLRVLKKAGENAVRAAKDTARLETLDRMNEHWTSGSN